MIGIRVLHCEHKTRMSVLCRISDDDNDDVNDDDNDNGVRSIM